jgi:hypothetical protein
MACGHICKLYAFTTKSAKYFKRLGIPFIKIFTCVALADQPTMSVAALFQKRLDTHGKQHMHIDQNYLKVLDKIWHLGVVVVYTTYSQITIFVNICQLQTTVYSKSKFNCIKFLKTAYIKHDKNIQLSLASITDISNVQRR